MTEEQQLDYRKSESERGKHVANVSDDDLKKFELLGQKCIF